MSVNYKKRTVSPDRFIGRKIGDYTIQAISFLDSNTTLICCEIGACQNSEGNTCHLEAEHWLDENTFHYNTCFYNDGDFVEAESTFLKPALRSSFEHIFCSIR